MHWSLVTIHQLLQPLSHFEKMTDVHSLDHLQGLYVPLWIFHKASEERHMRHSFIFIKHFKHYLCCCSSFPKFEMKVACYMTTRKNTTYIYVCYGWAYLAITFVSVMPISHNINTNVLQVVLHDNLYRHGSINQRTLLFYHVQWSIKVPCCTFWTIHTHFPAPPYFWPKQIARSQGVALICNVSQGDIT